jgi:hypothetical protein
MLQGAKRVLIEDCEATSPGEYGIRIDGASDVAIRRISVHGHKDTAVEVAGSVRVVVEDAHISDDPPRQAALGPTRSANPQPGSEPSE